MLLVFMIAWFSGHCDDPDAEWSCQLPCKATCHVRNFGNCGTVCKDDCYCKQDYILDSKNNKCVKVEDCFADQKKLVKN